MGNASEVVREVGIDDSGWPRYNSAPTSTTACWALRPGRYAYCSGGRSASKIGSLRAALSGMVRLRAFTAVRLMTRSNLMGCSTGRSAGLIEFGDLRALDELGQLVDLRLELRLELRGRIAHGLLAGGYDRITHLSDRPVLARLSAGWPAQCRWRYRPEQTSRSSPRIRSREILAPRRSRGWEARPFACCR